MNTKLMNFRIPLNLKIQFNTICNFKQTNMSIELNKLIEDYIIKESPNINLVFNNQNEPKKWGHLIQDPVTKVWSRIKGY